MVSIAEERRRLADVGMRLRRREQWGARFDYTNSRDVDEPATRVFVHITVSNPGSYSSNDQHARAIEHTGIQRFGNTGISYNRLIMTDGSAYEGQPMGRRGAHTVNDYRRSTCSTSGCPSRGGPLTAPSWNLNVNARAYAICQNVNDRVTDATLHSLARCIAADKRAGLVTRNAKIHGHRCVTGKSCPADPMWARMDELDALVDRYMDGDDDMSWKDKIKSLVRPDGDERAELALARTRRDAYRTRRALLYSGSNNQDNKFAQASGVRRIDNPMHPGDEDDPEHDKPVKDQRRASWRWAVERIWKNTWWTLVRTRRIEAKLDGLIKAQDERVQEAVAAALAEHDKRVIQVDIALPDDTEDETATDDGES